MPEPRMLIVGAGPTGLVLALWLARVGISFRIIEKNGGPGQASRAMAVQARTLEFYRQLGFAEEVVRSGIQVQHLRIRQSGREVAALDFGDFGRGLSAYPFVLTFPQDDHERLLAEKLRAGGVEIGWNTELAGFAEDAAGISAELRKNGGTENCRVEYICGCNGAHSRVREQLGIGFPGGIYEEKFFVADVKAEGATVNGDVNFSLTANELCLAFPIRSTGMVRLIGILPREVAAREPLGFEDIRARFERLMDIRVSEVNWFSTYHVHHRVAEHFRKGRAFLAGDAAHVHSPAGGQGMNTGIGDAVNLSWKLAAVLKDKAAPAILDSYETERIAFARSLVATTDQLFQGVTERNLVGEAVRTVVVPYIAPMLLRVPMLRHFQFRLISQIRINYRDSMLSRGAARAVRGGDRLPWFALDGTNNFEPLKSLDWQIHIYGQAQAGFREGAQSRGIPLHEFPWNEAAHEAGLERDAFYLLRPDGHVALADSRQDPQKLIAYLSRFKIEPIQSA